MSKLGELKLCLMVLPFVFFLNFGGAMGQERCILPTVTEEVKDIETWLKLRWDPANPEEIDQNGEVTPKVIRGIAPYRWQVSGNGFTLACVASG